MSGIDAISFQITWPWGSPVGQIAPTSEGRLCITTAADVDRIVVHGFGDDLPLLTAWTDSSGRDWKRFELPSVVAEAETGPVSETLTLILELRGSGRLQRPISMAGLPKLSHADQRGKADAWQDLWCEASAHSERTVDSHIDLVNRLYDEDQPCDLADAWQGLAGGMALRPLGAAAQSWNELGERDEPRMALIIRLARDSRFRDRLRDVCHRPRRILGRQRHMQRIARIQEADPACIRWLVRQPGVSLAQKAGVRQESLGVIRVETADTPENRVVRDLVLRAIHACNRYIAENHRFGHHSRVSLVWEFRQELRGYLTRTPLVDVRSLVGVPSPNYVLQHDARYSPLWDVYVKLVRQQKEQDDAWRWRQRIWAEHVVLGVIASLQTATAGIVPIHADLLVRPEQVYGRFLDPAGIPSSWQFADETGVQAIDLVPGSSLVPNNGIGAHPGIPAQLAELGPDLLLVRRSASGARPFTILAIWAMLDFDKASDGLERRVDSLSQALQALTLPVAVRGLLVQPPVDYADGNGNMKVAHGLATGIRVASRQGAPGLAAALWEGLCVRRSE